MIGRELFAKVEKVVLTKAVTEAKHESTTLGSLTGGSCRRVLEGQGGELIWEDMKSMLELNKSEKKLKKRLYKF